MDEHSMISVHEAASSIAVQPCRWRYPRRARARATVLFVVSLLVATGCGNPSGQGEAEDGRRGSDLPVPRSAAASATGARHELPRTNKPRSSVAQAGAANESRVGDMFAAATSRYLLLLGTGHTAKMAIRAAARERASLNGIIDASGEEAALVAAGIEGP